MSPDPVGMFFQGCPKPFLDALMRMPTEAPVELFSGWCRQGPMPPQRRRPATLRPMARAPDFVATTELRAWHGTEAEIFRPRVLRERFAKRAYPITFSLKDTHSPEALQAIVQSLLWGHSEVFDSVICTSLSSQAEVRQIIEKSETDLARQTGGEHRWRGRIDRVPHGVAAWHFRPVDRANARLTFGVPQRAFVVLHTGRLDGRRTAFRPLLSAVRHLQELHRDVDVRVVLSGAVEAPKHVDAIFEEAMTFGVADALLPLGAIPFDDRPLVYATADVFVTTSDHDGEGVDGSMLEAMSCGVPQVVPDCGGYRDVVVHGETGFLVNPDALAHRLELLLEDEDRRRRMARTSRNRARDQHDWSRVIGDYERLWDELAALASER